MVAFAKSRQSNGLIISYPNVKIKHREDIILHDSRVCCDNRLREAAKKEGFSVLPNPLIIQKFPVAS